MKLIPLNQNDIVLYLYWDDSDKNELTQFVFSYVNASTLHV